MALFMPWMLKACLHLAMRMTSRFKAQSSKRLGVLCVCVCVQVHLHAHADLWDAICKRPFGWCCGPTENWKKLKAMGQLHHGNPTNSQQCSLASQTRKLSPNSAPWQSSSNNALRDKRSRNPNEDRQRVFLGNQQSEQRVSTDTSREEHSPGKTPPPN